MVEYRGPVRKSLKAYIQLNSFLYTKLGITLRYIIATERIKAGMKQIKKNIQKQWIRYKAAVIDDACHQIMQQKIQILKNEDIQDRYVLVLPAILWNPPW